MDPQWATTGWLVVTGVIGAIGWTVWRLNSRIDAERDAMRAEVQREVDQIKAQMTMDVKQVREAQEHAARQDEEFSERLARIETMTKSMSDAISRLSDQLEKWRTLQVEKR